MDEIHVRQTIRDYLGKCLAEKGDTGAFVDHELLITNGRLDSLEVVRLVVFLEDTFGVDFSTIDFDKGLLDSLDAIVTLVVRYK